MTHLIDTILKPVDAFLNKITMYKLVFYELVGLLLIGGVLGYFHLIAANPLYLAYSTAFIFIISWVTNRVFAAIFNAPYNPESTYITALILALIISPPHAFMDATYFAIAGWGSAIAIASKYIFAIRDKHIFNPAAFGVAAVGLFLTGGASWWVGTFWMLPFVVIGGGLVTRKIRRFDLVLSFLAFSTFTMLFLGLNYGIRDAAHVVQRSIEYAPMLFLATVMLTEPLTTPPTRFLRILYGALVGFFYAPQVHFGSFYFTPELALIVGNVFSYLVSPKEKLILKLKGRIRLSPDTYEFIFTSNRKMRFAAGQYLEWTLPHAKADGRGIRRYFTIASSPTDPDFRLGVKFYQPASSFKKRLLEMQAGETIVASQLAGDFTLPRNKKEKLVFIAGGIGVTPFRSMLQYLLDKKEPRDIRMIYSNKTVKDVAYVDVIDRAERELGIETIPVITNPEPGNERGFPKTVDAALIRETIPDYKERMFYLSGPHGMVTAYSDLLANLGVPSHRIKRDFFPGFA